MGRPARRHAPAHSGRWVGRRTVRSPDRDCQPVARRSRGCLARRQHGTLVGPEGATRAVRWAWFEWERTGAARRSTIGHDRAAKRHRHARFRPSAPLTRSPSRHERPTCATCVQVCEIGSPVGRAGTSAGSVGVAGLQHVLRVDPRRRGAAPRQWCQLLSRLGRRHRRARVLWVTGGVHARRSVFLLGTSHSPSECPCGAACQISRRNTLRRARCSMRTAVGGAIATCHPLRYRYRSERLRVTGRLGPTRRVSDEQRMSTH